MNADEAKRAAVSAALDAVGLAPDGDEDIAEDLIEALKELGYVIKRDPVADPDQK